MDTPQNINEKIDKLISSTNEILNIVKDLRTKEIQQLLLSYQILNRQKIEKIRNKINKKNKIRVFFIVSYISKFEAKSVYDEMLSSDLFDPYIYIVHPKDLIWNDFLVEAEENYKLFKERGYKAIFAYDKNGKYIDISKHKPDIVFYNNPNIYRQSSIKNVNTSFNYLTCYITYSMCVVDNFGYHFDNYQINTAWKIFAETQFAYNQFVNKSVFNGLNVQFFGYPKLDPYKKPEEEVKIPSKIDNGKPIFIYAPHWTLRVDNNWSTFHLYNQYFLDLVKNNKDINFVFKPHPDLEYRIRALDDSGKNFTLSREQYHKYIEEWNSLENGIYINDGEYIDLFRRSSCLITDCGSFIAEYLPSNHPCIYLLNPEKKDPLNGYNDLGKKILKTYICCNNLIEVDKAISDVIKKKDRFKKERDKVLRQEFTNIGNAGRSIVKYLEETILED